MRRDSVRTEVSEPSMYITASQGGAASLAASQLQKTATGEYTAGSVAVNPTEAIRLLLTRQEDGNFAALGSPMARSSNAVRSAVYGLALGG